MLSSVMAVAILGNFKGSNSKSSGQANRKRRKHILCQSIPWCRV